MTILELQQHISLCLIRLEEDGHSKEVMDTNRWITAHFAQYCDDNQYEEITFELIEEFLRRQYAIDPYEKLCAVQISIRRPLLILWEYSQTGNYLKSHLPEQKKVPPVYNGLYIDFCNHINTLALNVKTKTAKARFAKCFLEYLYENDIKDISEVSPEDIARYINSKTDMSYTTKQTIAYNLREMLNCLYDTGVIAFSGFDAFPKVRYPGRKFISSCYSNDEIRKMMDCVDTDTTVGKNDYLVLSLLIYYGLRVSDILALCLDNIDWSADVIRLVQQKTQKALALPLIDEVKYGKKTKPELQDCSSGG